MTATVMDGKAALAEILVDLTARVEKLAAAGVTPGLGTLLVGDDPGSHAYVRGKHRDCAKVGIASIQRELPADATQADVERAIDELNADPACTGFIVQLPLPARARRGRRAGAGRPGQGRRRAAPGEPRAARARRGGAAAVHAARDRGAVQALRRRARRGAGHGGGPRRHRRPPARPAAHPAQRERTVTLCHTGTRDLAAEVRRADVVVAAAGVAGLITADMVAPGATVLDVGVTRTELGLVGDVAPEVAEVAGLLAPMPGGVGPMTRAMLLTNVVEAAERSLP